MESQENINQINEFKREDCTLERDMDRLEMINEIRRLNFAIQDLALYLDTHPEDTKALYMHRDYCERLKMAKDMYQNAYGPLSIYYPCNKWRWIEEPWPWLNLEVNNYLSV